MTYENSDPATIELELAEARARLDAHLDELTNRVSPGQLFDDGLNYLRTGAGAEFARNLGVDLRDNPLPIAVTGIGLAWLMASSALSGNRTARGTASAEIDEDVAVRAQRAGETVTRLAEEGQDAFNARVAEARAQVLGLQREFSETTAAFVERVQQGLESAQQGARERLEQVRQTARDWGATIADQSRRTGDAVDQAAQQGLDMVSRAALAITGAVNENPLLLGALGLTAGVLLAALLPVTEQEAALAAPVGGTIRRAADEALNRGKRAAEAAVKSAYQEVVKQ